MIVYSEYCESYSLFILFNLNFVQQMSRVQLYLHINIYIQSISYIFGFMQIVELSSLVGERFLDFKLCMTSILQMHFAVLLKAYTYSGKNNKTHSKQRQLKSPCNPARILTCHIWVYMHTYIFV